jgi:hypothetical protein
VSERNWKPGDKAMVVFRDGVRRPAELTPGFIWAATDGHRLAAEGGFDAEPMTGPQPTPSAEVAEWLRDERLTMCGHGGADDQCCSPCLRDRILASDWLAAYVQAARDEERARVVADFAHWVATNRAYNGSEHLHGQSLYNECINAVLSTWAWEFAREAGGGAR